MVALVLAHVAAMVAAATAPAPRVHFTVEVNGDLLIHSPIYQRALALGGGRRYDFRPMLRAIRPRVSGAALALCHVETPMAPGPPHGYPVFNTPRGLARSIRATGWDACDTASNHTLDRGQVGVDSTIAALDKAGVHHTGSARSAKGARRIRMLRVRGVRIAYLAYTEMTNGIPKPHPWSVNLARPRLILHDARRARRRGAQAVIVNLHWGTEYQSAPDAFQLALARRLTASKAITAVVGQHVHVVQPIRWMHHKPVVFGEGNLLSNQTSACCPAASQDGLMALLRFVAGPRGVRVKRVDYVPVWVRHPDYLVVPIGTGLKKGLADRGTLVASYRRTVEAAGRSRRTAPLPRRLTQP
jgi:poly-gamma-glutamate synthesis protein (capsule biosynthesis protein)